MISSHGYYQYRNEDNEHLFTVLDDDLITSGTTITLSSKELEAEGHYSIFVDSLQELKDYIAKEKLDRLLTNFERTWDDGEYFYEFVIYDTNNISEAITYEHGKFKKGVTPKQLVRVEFWYEIPFEVAKSLVDLKLRNKNLGDDWWMNLPIK